MYLAVSLYIPLRAILYCFAYGTLQIWPRGLNSHLVELLLCSRSDGSVRIYTSRHLPIRHSMCVLLSPPLEIRPPQVTIGLVSDSTIQYWGSIEIDWLLRSIIIQYSDTGSRYLLLIAIMCCSKSFCVIIRRKLVLEYRIRSCRIERS